jgi:putative transposase
MLSSYSQSINKQLKRSGSLFRNNTKSECVTNCKGISPSFIDISGGTIIKNYVIEKEYPKACFDYIHHNPVKSGLVEKPEDWEFSSYRDVYGLRNGSLINRERIEEYGLK